MVIHAQICYKFTIPTDKNKVSSSILWCVFIILRFQVAPKIICNLNMRNYGAANPMLPMENLL